uniref:Aspartate aminotransferase, mitochondrial n=1 Tax=Caenorhabditis japonica TaxID=281687 RepID=A0A8R1IAX1_CAEJA
MGIGSEFLVKYAKTKVIYQPTPTWGNQVPVFKFAGVDVKQYHYYAKKTCGFDEAGALADIVHLRNFINEQMMRRRAALL